MKRLSVILICCALITTVSSLTCESCIAKNAATCTGSNVTCDPSVTSCISSMVEVTYETVKINELYKSCSSAKNQEICNSTYSITLEDFHMESNTYCCKSDHCNQDVPQIAPRNLTKNGLQCPFCVQSGLNGCIPRNHTLCTGLEDRCIKFSGYLSTEDTPQEISYKGCATHSACLVTPELSPDAKSGVGISCTKPVKSDSEESKQNSTVLPTPETSYSINGTGSTSSWVRGTDSTRNSTQSP
ncbi:phospholipase A2 inhibitor and Ly6/PLAUR domain-containing protein-like [Dendropsophus ebraccatus]|uniref:phospholipase A2 inhibitor and Ly6/PLAUR domain-containing protein-like n=1 Tax=Dendropsophus ebraccatus TaxID=150705 RepID=UPI003831C5B5